MINGRHVRNLKTWTGTRPEESIFHQHMWEMSTFLSYPGDKVNHI